MSLRTPSEINSFWFGKDRSKFNDPAHIKFTMGKWFARTVPEVEITFIAESEQIDRLVDAGSLDEEWFTPEGAMLSTHSLIIIEHMYAKYTCMFSPYCTLCVVHVSMLNTLATAYIRLHCDTVCLCWHLLPRPHCDVRPG